MIMCQCRSINCNKCATLMAVVDNGGGSGYVKTESIWVLYTFHSIFLETITVLKKSLLKSKNKQAIN